MAKILLVEDDNNLREIYEARLQAEGYTIVSAQDGEEALVKAKQEKPDLVVSDVMMPRISGFEMLDILRNTEGLKDTKVIMLTALGQSDDKTRADALGADRYLVKSQVTLEDIVKAADELLKPAASAEKPAENTATPTTTPTPTIMPVQAAPANEPAATLQPHVAVVPAPAAAPAMSVDASATPKAASAITSQPVASATSPASSDMPAPSPSNAPEPVAPPLANPSKPVSQTPSTDLTPKAAPASQTPDMTPAKAASAEQTGGPHITPTDTMPTTPVPTPPSSPAAANSTSQPSANLAPTSAPTAPVTPPAKADSTPPSISATESKAPGAAVPATSNTPTPADTPKTASADDSQRIQADDQLMATAVKQLTDTLAPKTDAVAVEKSVENSTLESATPKISAVSTPPSESEQPTPPPVAAESAPQPPKPPVEVPTPSETDKPVLQPLSTTSIPEDTAPDLTAPAPSAKPITSKPAPLINTATTADEQALMRKQINDFIQQQGAGTAETTDKTSENAPVEQTTDQDPSLSVVSAPFPGSTAQSSPSVAPETTIPNPTTIQPTDTAPPPTATATEQGTEDFDNVNIAHKKIIQPPVNPMQVKPDLNELLAKEGIGVDDHDEPEHPAAPFAPPHQPGHVISPNGSSAPNPNDPNNIAL